MSRKKKNKRFAAELSEIEFQRLMEALSSSWFTSDSFTGSYSLNGAGNNDSKPSWGGVNEQLVRLTSTEFGDGVSSPGGTTRPSARVVSNEIVAQSTSVENGRFLTDMTWLWGQFVDHDLDLTETALDSTGGSAEPYAIAVPQWDAYFDPYGTGDQTISFGRAGYIAGTGTSSDNPRQYHNEITSFLDGSVVYGVDEERSTALRTLEGGRLKTSEGDLLPFNEGGLSNAGGTSDSLFLAGDVRANENAALSAMHTVWVREHNFWAERLAARDPSLDDEQLFQQARSIVTAELQAITYNEFLPSLLGYGALDRYEGYDASVNPNIAAEFSTAAYRFGHSMLSSELLRLNADGTVADEGNLSLQDAFFAPDELVDNGIDSLLLGVSTQQAQEIDNLVVDDVRNFLFGPPGAGGFDLAALNIQRGRDMGLANFNQTRRDLGLDPITSFADITSDSDVAAKLESLYGSVGDVDLWVGGLAEDHAAGSSLGETFQTILVDQFQRIRDGDAKFYAANLPDDLRELVDNTILADVLERNTDLDGLQRNVFLDNSVMYYRPDARHPEGRLRLTATSDSVTLFDDGFRQQVDHRSTDELSQIQLVGTDTGKDRITIDLRRANQKFSEDVLIYGGDDNGNSLFVTATQQADKVVFAAGGVNVNGSTINWNRIDTLRFDTGGGKDRVEILESLDASFSQITNRQGSRMIVGTALGESTSIRNSGSFFLREEGISSGPSFTQTAGFSRIDGRLQADAIKVSRGVITGDGELAGLVHIDRKAILRVGQDDREFTIDGDLRLSGRVESEVFAANDYDQLNVQGELRLASTSSWNLVFRDAVSATLGATFRIATADSIVGNIAAQAVRGVAGFDYSLAKKSLADGRVALEATVAGHKTGVFLSDDGVLRVHGSRGNDRIVISTQDGLSVGLNGQTYRFDSEAVSGIQVRGLEGNDTIDGRRSDLAMEVYGGDGRDRIWGGSSDDSIRGGAGNDELLGRAGDDRILGGAGADRIVGGFGVDAVNGNGGRDRIEVTGTSGIDRVLATTLSESRFQLTLEMPAGDSRATETLFFNPLDQIELSTGHGNDVIDLRGASPHSGRIDGGPGQDDIRAGNNWIVSQG